MEYLSNKYDQWFRPSRNRGGYTRQQLKELASGSKEEVLRAYALAAEDLRQWSGALNEARRRAKHIQGSNSKSQANIDRDWKIGYAQGKRDEAAQQTHQTLNDIYQQASENANWGVGYFQGRLEEAQTLADEVFQGESAPGWQLTKSIWEKAQEAAAEAASKGQAAVNSGSGWVQRAMVDPIKDAANEASQAGYSAKEAIQDKAEEVRDAAKEAGSRTDGWFHWYGREIAREASREGHEARQAAGKAGDSIHHGGEWLGEHLWPNSKSTPSVGISEKAYSFMAGQKHSYDSDKSRIVQLAKSLEEARSRAATYLNHQVGLLTEQAEIAADSARHEADSFYRESKGNLKKAIQQISQSSGAARDVAAADRDKMTAFIKDTLSRLEQDAKEKYIRAQQSRDELSDQTRQQLRSLTRQTRQISDSASEATQERFEKLANKVLEQSEQAEEYARQRYGKARRMREQTESMMEDNLNEAYENLRNWLRDTQRETQQAYDQALTNGRVISDELVGSFQAALSHTFGTTGPKDTSATGWWRWLTDSAHHANQDAKDKLYDHIVQPIRHAERNTWNTFSSGIHRAEQAASHTGHQIQDSCNRFTTGAEEILTRLPLTLFYGSILIALATYLVRRVRYKKRIMHYPRYPNVYVPDAEGHMVHVDSKHDADIVDSDTEDDSKNKPLPVADEKTVHAQRVASTHDSDSHTLPIGLPAGQQFIDANPLLSAVDSMYHTLYTVPAALLMFGMLEYIGSSRWLLHSLYLTLTSGQALQASRNIVQNGRMLADVGETSSLVAILIASFCCLYASIVGSPPF